MKPTVQAAAEEECEERPPDERCSSCFAIFLGVTDLLEFSTSHILSVFTSVQAPGGF